MALLHEVHPSPEEESDITYIERDHLSRQALEHPDDAVRGAARKPFGSPSAQPARSSEGSQALPTTSCRTSVTSSADLPAMQAGRMRRDGRPQRGPNEADLDHLINSPIDVLNDLLGPCPGTCCHDETWSVSK